MAEDVRQGERVTAPRSSQAVQYAHGAEVQQGREAGDRSHWWRSVDRLPVPACFPRSPCAVNPVGWFILAAIAGVGAILGLGMAIYKFYRWVKKKSARRSRCEAETRWQEGSSSF